MPSLLRSPSLIVLLVLLLVAACSNSDGATDANRDAEVPPEERDVEVEEVPQETAVVVEMARGAEALAGGDGDAALRVTGAAVVDGAVVVAGDRSDAERRHVGASISRSTDGRSWEVVELPGAEGLSITSIAPLADGAIVIASNRGGPGATALLTEDGRTFEAVDLPLPPPPPNAEPFFPDAVASSGDAVVVFASGVEVPEGGGAVQVGTAAVVVSADAGRTWEAVTLPDALARQAGGLPMPLLAMDGSTVVMALTAAGAEGVTTTIGRSTDSGRTWDVVGDGELLDGGQPTLLHPHSDGRLLAFTTAGGDAALWASDDDGIDFERIELAPHVLGGSGSQRVDAAASLDDGGLLLVGTTRTSDSSRTVGHPEIWHTSDLESWQRSIDDPALDLEGSTDIAGLVELDGAFVAIGTEERWPERDEREQFEAALAEGTGPGIPPALARDGVTWLIGLEQRPPVPQPITADRLELQGFGPGSNVRAAVVVADATIAVGDVSGDDGDQAAVWRSEDARTWTRVEAPELSRPGDQSIRSVLQTDAGLVAIGWHVPDEGRTVPVVWQSVDGTSWTAQDLPAEAGIDAYGYDLTDAGGELLAVGERSEWTDGVVSRTALLWRSGDGGSTWTEQRIDGSVVGESGIEVLSGVDVGPAGLLVGTGFKGDPEPTEGGYIFRARPWLITSDDGGGSWTALEGPPIDGRYGFLHGAITDGDDLLVHGELEGTPDDSDRIGSMTDGLFRIRNGRATVPGDRVRQPTVIGHVVATDLGLLAIGEVRRYGAGSDAVIGLLDGDSLQRVGTLMAEGDQVATAAIALDGEVIVLGSSTTGGTTEVAAWRVERS